MRLFFASAALPLSIAAQSALAASPSFDCRTNHSILEQLICSEDALTKLDVELNQAYSMALKRIGPRNALALRSDQRAYVIGTADGVKYRLNDASPEVGGRVPDNRTENSFFGRQAAVAALKWRTEIRIRVLKSIEPNRKGFEGLWRSQSGHVEIAKAEKGYTVSARTSMFGWHRYWCEAEGEAHLEGNSLILNATATDGSEAKLRITRVGTGLAVKTITSGGRGFCPRGGDLDKSAYFVPISQPDKEHPVSQDED